MIMMGYFRAPLFASRKGEEAAAGAAAAAREGLHAALLEEEEEAAAGREVPKGYFAVYVGAEERRFVVPTSYLRRPAFRELMERAAEEFGFGQAGGLRVPCAEADFEAIVAALQAEEDRLKNCTKGRKIRL